MSSSVDNIVIRGTGTDNESGTVLRFDNQSSGAQGILATGNNFVIEDIAVENTPGDSIRVEGSNGVTIRRVRVEWTDGPNENNGAYGLYPVQTRNVLIEDSEVRGASDAGVYVGQSEIIIVRRNYAWENVAGIELKTPSSQMSMRTRPSAIPAESWYSICRTFPCRAGKPLACSTTLFATTTSQTLRR